MLRRMMLRGEILMGLNRCHQSVKNSMELVLPLIAILVFLL